MAAVGIQRLPMRLGTTLADCTQAVLQRQSPNLMQRQPAREKIFVGHDRSGSCMLRTRRPTCLLPELILVLWGPKPFLCSAPSPRPGSDVVPTL